MPEILLALATLKVLSVLEAQSGSTQEAGGRNDPTLRVARPPDGADERIDRCRATKVRLGLEYVVP